MDVLYWCQSKDEPFLEYFCRFKVWYGYREWDPVLKFWTLY